MANATTMHPIRPAVLDYAKDYDERHEMPNICRSHSEQTRDTSVDLRNNFGKIIERFENLRLTQNYEDADWNASRCERIIRKTNDSSENTKSRLSPDFRNNSRNRPAKRENRNEDAESNRDDGWNDSKDSKLVERGPIRPQFSYSAREQPYCATSNWLPRSVEKNELILDYDTTAEEILRDRDYCEKLNPCLDQLEGSTVTVRSYAENSWGSRAEDDRKKGKDILNGCTAGQDAASLPAIVVDDTAEDSLLEILSRGGFQAAQMLAEGGNNSLSPPAMKTWPDSPVSGYNVTVSRSESRASSRAQSPGSGTTNLGSPLMHGNLTCSPIGSPQVSTSLYRVPQGFSSSSSSNQSYGDTPSPVGYQAPLNHRLEERLGQHLDNFPFWNDGYESSGTVVNSVREVAGTVNSVDTIGSIDSNELQLVEEVLRDLGSEGYEEEAQVVPKSRRGSSLGYDEYDANRSTFVPYEHPKTSYHACVSPGNNSNPELISFARECVSDRGTHDTGVVIGALSTEDTFAIEATNYEKKMLDFEIASALAFDYGSSSSTMANQVENRNHRDIHRSKETASRSRPMMREFSSASSSSSSTPSSASNAILEGYRKLSFDASKAPISDSTVNDFQIPEMVASFETGRRRRNSDRTILPWPSLNLPSVRASERLKEGLNPKDVERAMSSLLKRPVGDLARPDEDGDTMLMCLVGNPHELTKKRAYLAPLVERLSNVKGALTMANNRGEDALYLAAMNCHRLSYVAGYLAATMLQKGIDISQRLYHTRGDTLIHSVAARGDSHGEVLAELLALRTIQGNAVFDLSKRNYDGRTALHVAVESHDPVGKSVVSVATVRLLLKHGADPKIKETKCGDTALHMAVSLSFDPALVKVLLAGCSPDVINATNYNQNTALHMASAAPNSVSFERQKEVCWLLVNAGGQSNLQNRQGKTPLALVPADRKETIRRIFYKKS